MADKPKSTKVAPLSTDAKAEVKAAESEIAKAKGTTESQEAVKSYHEGKFQTHDPVTGEKRDKPLS